MKMQDCRKRQMICLGTALAAAAAITLLLLWQRGMLVEARTQDAQEELAGQVLRFHVLADSDSNRDQQLKMDVKEEILSYMKENMPETDSLEATVEWAGGQLDSLEEKAREELRSQGCMDEVQAELVKDYFPEKSYGDVTFPAGEYTALRVKIGSGQGHNWWCCLYPDLCFTDAVRCVVPEEGKEQMGNVLSEDAYDMVTAFSDFKIKWFFFGRDTSGRESDKTGA